MIDDDYDCLDLLKSTLNNGQSIYWFDIINF